MSHGIQILVKGDFACFTRPEMKVERVSYDVMTPSVARGISKAIFAKSHRFTYPPYSLYMTDRVWGGRSEIQLPNEIRQILEASAHVPSDMPQGMTELHRDFLAKIKEQLNTAFQNGVFTAAAVNDVEGTQTRWKMQPTAYLVMKRAFISFCFIVSGTQTWSPCASIPT